MNDLAREIAEWREGRGFYTPDSISSNVIRAGVEFTDADAMLGKLALVHSEIAEASEAVREGDTENFEEELADAVIRILDICGTCGIDIDTVLAAKMERNRQRPIRHGKKTTL